MYNYLIDTQIILLTKQPLNFIHIIGQIQWTVRAQLTSSDPINQSSTAHNKWPLKNKIYPSIIIILRANIITRQVVLKLLRLVCQLNMELEWVSIRIRRVNFVPKRWAGRQPRLRIVFESNSKLLVQAEQ